MKVICENKQARFEYFIEDGFEAGISLDGGEVKSIRRGNVSLKDAYCSIYKGSIIVKNMHIALYKEAGAYNVKDDKRDRRLLLHKAEIRKISSKCEERGYTLVPIKLYFKGSLIKIEVALCKGKHTYDKKKVIAERDVAREMQREIKKYV
ncbi:MAG: SsrA-binding protein SmpB [Clostridia bacterium]|nr:SsrA-binding protein SmpB [Clostridia bacterium]MBP5373071.1 SsrA-binding protein SmpB [Clostridia bacterium]